MTWGEPPDPAAGRAYDICDDEQAIAIGLDGGALDEERASLGVSCEPGADPSNRFHFVGYGGDVHPIEEPEFDPQGALVVDPAWVEQWMTPPEGSGIRLGSTFDGAPAPTKRSAAGLEVLDDTTSVHGGYVRGLILNATSTFQENVTVTVSDASGDEVGRSTIPYAVLAGEAAAYEVSVSSENDLQVSVTGQSATALPLGRAMAIAGPGWWVPPPGGSVGSYDDTYAVDDALAAQAEARAVYSTGLAAVTPLELNADIGVDSSVDDPHLVVASFGRDGRVLDVGEVSIRGYGGDDATEIIDDDLPESTSGWSQFYVPQGVTALGLWAYGVGR